MQSRRCSLSRVLEYTAHRRRNSLLRPSSQPLKMRQGHLLLPPSLWYLHRLLWYPRWMLVLRLRPQFPSVRRLLLLLSKVRRSLFPLLLRVLLLLPLLLRSLRRQSHPSLLLLLLLSPLLRRMTGLLASGQQKPLKILAARRR